MNNLIFGVNGPIVTIKDSVGLAMSEMVYIGHAELVGEIIGIHDNITVIQVYEETTGLMIGDIVKGTGRSVSAQLGPGLIGNIFDGIGRSLVALEKKHGAFLPIGSNIGSLDEEHVWEIKKNVKIGDVVKSGDLVASTQETSLIENRILVPPDINGIVTYVNEKSELKISDKLISIKIDSDTVKDIYLFNFWPIRLPRPIKRRLDLNVPLITGQRIIDTIFPISKGGSAIIPGGFGAGKTMLQHQLAKWCETDIIIYVGCGERGNEMTQVLQEFSELIDPKTGKSLTERTIFIANTSNMPVSAREASIYTGVTYAEYFRDMGYHVTMMADSTSRWAEALREISGRLEEMPAEEGYPPYLSSRLSSFYERAGRVVTLNDTVGSVTLIGAVSPQGADFSEPVTQNSRRYTRCFWALDKNLAYARHYPAINWVTSYSEYFSELDSWFLDNYGEKFIKNRNKIIFILKEEQNLMEIVKLVGQDVLPDEQKLTIETAKLIKIGFLQQNAFHEFDKFVSLKKQNLMMEIILYLNNKVKNLILASMPITKVFETGIFEEISKIKYEINENELEKFDDYIKKIDEKLANIVN